MAARAMQRRIRLSSPGASSRGGANPDRAAEIDVGNGAEKQSPVAPDTNVRNLAGRHAGGALRCGEIETREPCVVGFLLVRTALDAPDNWECVDWVTVARPAGRPILPASATAQQQMTSCRFSNIPPFPS